MANGIPVAVSALQNRCKLLNYTSENVIFHTLTSVISHIAEWSPNVIFGCLKDETLNVVVFVKLLAM
jgi:hypothetical protein